MLIALLCALVLSACASGTAGPIVDRLDLQLRPAANEWDAAGRSDFVVGDHVMLHVLLPADPLGAPITVSQYRVRIQGAPRSDQTRPTPTNQLVSLNPPSVFRPQDLRLLRWQFEIAESMAQGDGRFTVVVTIPELDLRGSTRLRVSSR